MSAITSKHAAIGAVHGRGLYLGIDLVAAQGVKSRGVV
jgi:4-aminobutyrate aminotransferase-like enzyme